MRDNPDASATGVRPDPAVSYDGALCVPTSREEEKRNSYVHRTRTSYTVEATREGSLGQLFV